MPYLVDTVNVADAALRDRVRPRHLDYLDAKMSLLIAAGAKLSDDGKTPTGSFYILDVEDRAAAEAFMRDEPYNASGVCASVTYTRWRKAILNYARQTPV